MVLGSLKNNRKLHVAFVVGFCSLQIWWTSRSTKLVLAPKSTLEDHGKTRDNSLHWSQTEHLGLFDWEEEALQGIFKDNATQSDAMRTCKPPEGVSKRCCVGSHSRGGSVKAENRHYCGKQIGEGLPLVEEATRKFMKENAIEDSERERCDVCRIIEIARKHNISMVFLGDSMQTQVFQGMMCEIQRRNYDVWTNETRWEVEEPWSNSQIMLSQKTRIRSKLWKEDEVVEMNFFMVYMLEFEIEEQRLLIMNSGDVFVFGFGLHWRLKYHMVRRKLESYITTMANLFRNATAMDHVRLIMHRETSAQHFNSAGGLYETQDKATRERGGCVPIVPSENMYWRFNATKEAARLAGLDFVIAGPQMPPRKEDKAVTELIYLPYFNYTSELYHQHVAKRDCTHYCSNPFVYLPVWRSLRLALDREFKALPVDRAFRV